MTSITDKNSYHHFQESIDIHEKNNHYKSLMCMKDTQNGPRNDKSKDKFMEKINKLPGRENLKKKCVLPLGHSGKCSCSFTLLFKKNSITTKLVKKIDTAVYQTTGDDDYVYKNRSSRLDNNAISSQEEKKIRDKNQKKRCAIPLKDASTPILLAQAYLDWMTFIVNIKDIDQHLNKQDCNKDILTMITKNKEHLVSIYGSLNRQVFNESGNSICVITKNEIKLSDVSDPTRDNRVNILDTDIQLGHNNPRTDNYVSIRGENLIPMSRRGNLIIGEKVFTQDIWIDELKQIILAHTNKI